MLHNTVTRTNPSGTGPRLPHVRQDARRAEALSPEAAGASTARGFAFAQHRSQECSHTDSSEGPPGVRPSRSGPFGAETTTVGEMREIGGIQSPLNRRSVREFVVSLTQCFLRGGPVLVVEPGQRFLGTSRLLVVSSDAHSHLS
jgi:hypothetical protein